MENYYVEYKYKDEEKKQKIPLDEKLMKNFESLKEYMFYVVGVLEEGILFEEDKLDILTITKED